MTERPSPPAGEPSPSGPVPPASTSTWYGRIFGLVVGWGLVGLGIVGLFVPVLQGVLLIAAGLLVLSRHSRLVRHVLEKLRRRYPRVDAWLRRRRKLQGKRGEGA